MKLQWKLLPLVLLLSSCKEKGARVDTPSSAGDSATVESAPDAAKLPTKPTPEQLASVVRVRVAFGGLPARDVPGALIHRDEIPDKALVQGKDRFVLACLKGWKETQLKSKDGSIVISRNRVGDGGEMETHKFSAKLMDFNPETGVAVLLFAENFEYSADAGFHLDRQDASRSNVTALRTFTERDQYPRQYKKFGVESGAYLGGQPRPGIRAPLSNAHEDADAVQLAVEAPDKLAGFIEETTEGGARLVPLGQFKFNYITEQTQPSGAKSNAAAPTPALNPDDVPGLGDVKKFAIESAVRNVHLIAGGREALLELEGAPFWKRFSFDKEDWLPLPEGDLSTMSVTGNLSALFVLDRGGGEVRKYSLSDLALSGKAKLPASAAYRLIAAGCNSAYAPVHILAQNDSVALDPETLKRRDIPRFPDRMNDNSDRHFHANEPVSITGDGLALREYSSQLSYFYNGDVRGLEITYLDLGERWQDKRRGVSAGFTLDRDELEYNAMPGGRSMKSTPTPNIWSRWAKGLSENCPVIFRFQTGDARATPPTLPHIGCFSYFDTVPFAVVETPELSAFKVQSGELEGAWAFMDPYSMRLATLTVDRKTWVVRKLSVSSNLDHTVLINWPDTSVARGSDFIFTPIMLGGAHFSLGIFGKAGAENMSESNGTIKWPVAPDEFSSLRFFQLKVPGAAGAELSYPIEIHLSGQELSIAALPGSDESGLNFRGAGVKSLGNSEDGYRALQTSTYLFDERVEAIEGAVSGCAILRTEGNRVEFFSLQEKKVIGSIPSTNSMGFFPGAGALFEYDRGSRRLTRIAVPNGVRERSIVLSPELDVKGIGIGAESNSPISLASLRTPRQDASRLGAKTPINVNPEFSFNVMDSNSLESAGWSQPVTLARMMGQPDKTKLEDRDIIFFDHGPIRLPCSRNGRMVTFAEFFSILSPKYALIYPFERIDDSRSLSESGDIHSGGSLSGLIAISAKGSIYKGGVEVIKGVIPTHTPANTPCGRYQMIRKGSDGNADNVLEFRLTENGKPVLLAGRTDFITQRAAEKTIPQRFAMLGDNGPFAILHTSGRAMEIIDLDIPELAKKLAPEEFHVISQPVPYVIEGGTMQYQVETNNPDAVQTFQMHIPVPGARISPKGLLQYTAPAHITGFTQSIISIEIVGKRGQIVLHEFPVFVLPQARLLPPGLSVPSRPPI